MSKKVMFSPKPAAAPPPNADAWVSGGAPLEVAESAKKAEPAEKMKRFTFDVPEAMHRRIKTRCAERGVDMADEMRRILLEHFPER